LLASQGKALIHKYWGRYVALLNDEVRCKKWCVRGPTSNLPCYITRFRDLSIVYSRLADFRNLIDTRLTIDSRQLAIRVASGLNRADTSLLEQVSTVYPGECYEWARSNHRRSFYWNPVDVAQTDVIESLDEAAHALKTAGRHCVWSWSECYDASVHFLSGGLDSSILAGLLGTSPKRKKVLCLHMRGSNSTSDELPFAEAVATHAVLPLIVQGQIRTLNTADLVRFSPEASPVYGPGWHLAMIPAARALAKREGAQTIFHGSWGDALLVNFRPQEVAGDLVARSGISEALLPLILSLSATTMRSVWSIGLGALRDGWLARRKRVSLQQFLSPRRIVRKELWPDICADPALLEPWFASAKGLPLAKFSQVVQTAFPSDFYSQPGSPEDVEVTGLLSCSQPIVDLCLRIPTYLHVYNGRPRALARLAFSRELPIEVSSRYWKSGGADTLKSLLATSRAFIREMLLDGALVHDFLDRASVERALSGSPLKSEITDGELLDYIAIEAWIQGLRAGDLRPGLHAAS
jgi:asparagine synthase (glutamine-hydrolysing)